jgi:hypothetical protein
MTKQDEVAGAGADAVVVQTLVDETEDSERKMRQVLIMVILASAATLRFRLLHGRRGRPRHPWLNQQSSLQGT